MPAGTAPTAGPGPGPQTRLVVFRHWPHGRARHQRCGRARSSELFRLARAGLSMRRRRAVCQAYRMCAMRPKSASCARAPPWHPSRIAGSGATRGTASWTCQRIGSRTNRARNNGLLCALALPACSVSWQVCSQRRRGFGSIIRNPGTSKPPGPMGVRRL